MHKRRSTTDERKSSKKKSKVKKNKTYPVMSKSTKIRRETKIHAVSIQTTTPLTIPDGDNVTSFVTCNEIGQGDDIGNRTGRQIQMKYLFIKFQIANLLAAMNRFRVLVFISDDPSEELLQSDIVNVDTNLGSPSVLIYGCKPLSKKTMFWVLADETFPTQTAPVGETDGFNTKEYLELYIPLFDAIAEYKASDNVPIKGQIRFFVISELPGTGGSAGANILYNFNFGFNDPQ